MGKGRGAKPARLSLLRLSSQLAFRANLESATAHSQGLSHPATPLHPTSALRLPPILLSSLGVKKNMFPTLPLLRATSRSALNPKRLQTGLYDGRSIQSGNAVGETFNNKTRRTWLPNVQSKAVWSEALGRKLRLKVTVGALRTMDKVGGLDAYLFRMKPERLGEKGMKLRQMVSC